MTWGCVGHPEAAITPHDLLIWAILPDQPQPAPYLARCRALRAAE